MRLDELLLTELQDRGGFLYDEYKGWELKVAKRPTPAGKIRANAVHKKYRDQQLGPIDVNSSNEALLKLKELVDERMIGVRQGLKDAKGVAIDFNAAFTREIFNEIGDITAARFNREGDQVYLEILDPEYFEAGVGGEDFVKIGKRISGNENAADLYGFNPTLGRVKNMDLEANGRYTVEQEPRSKDDPVWRYSITLHSVAHTKSERMQLPTPGFNVAVY